MKYIILLPITLILLITCGNVGSNAGNVRKEIQDSLTIKETKTYSRFAGSYGKVFDDVHELHITVAEEIGIGPLSTRDDTATYANQLVCVPLENDFYTTKKLTHSVPYLVPEAATLLTDICFNFRDSLISQRVALYRPVITSITRTDADVKKLTRRNRNANDNSAHCYGTTFDISWRSFEMVDSTSTRTADHRRLKRVLAEVLYDLRFDDRCFVKYERRQPCFHITVR